MAKLLEAWQVHRQWQAALRRLRRILRRLDHRTSIFRWNWTFVRLPVGVYVHLCSARKSLQVQATPHLPTMRRFAFAGQFWPVRLPAASYYGSRLVLPRDDFSVADAFADDVGGKTFHQLRFPCAAQVLPWFPPRLQSSPTDDSVELRAQVRIRATVARGEAFAIRRNRRQCCNDLSSDVRFSGLIYHLIQGTARPRKFFSTRSPYERTAKALTPA